MDEKTILQIFWANPVRFFSQSGRLELGDIAIDQRQLYQGSSVLRGQTPVVDKP